MNILENYAGSKNGAGVYQKIISAMPEHKVFIELFAGSMAITRRKRPALRSVGVDIDVNVLDALKVAPPAENVELYISGALYFLEKSNVFATYKQRFAPGEILIYADPPYLMETRKSNRPIYNHEFGQTADHGPLIEILRAQNCNVMISGYRSTLYDELLHDWRRLDIPTTTRGGPAVESVWLNFPEPLRLHDYRFLGENFTDRQRIKRKRAPLGK